MSRSIDCIFLSHFTLVLEAVLKSILFTIPILDPFLKEWRKTGHEAISQRNA